MDSQNKTIQAMLGEKWADVLNIPVDTVSRFPKRWVTNWGTKTSLGIYETITNLVKEVKDVN